jgi:hypothetical protein
MSGEYWTIPEIWPDSTVFIIGGGPSVAEMDLSKIHEKRCIGVNQAYKLGAWVNVVWFGDKQWYSGQLPDILNYHGLIITCAQEARNDKRWKRVKYVGRSRASGIESHENKRNCIAWNGNSGASAINLAYWFGAKKVVLLGFEQSLPEEGEQTHWHNDYEVRKDNHGKLHNPYRTYLKHWGQIARDAKELGLEIVNATPTTAIEEIPQVSFESCI